MAARINPTVLRSLPSRGRSSAGKAVARRLGARAIEYLRPVHDYDGQARPEDSIRNTTWHRFARQAQDAWAIARSRYPDDEFGRENAEYYTRVSDSVWVKELDGGDCSEGHPYWLGPYKNGRRLAVPGWRARDIARELIGYFKMACVPFFG